MRNPLSRLLPCPRLLSLLLVAGSLPALAQPTITGLSPTRNLRNAPRTSNVALTFSQAISAASAGNVRVFSPQRGGQLNRPGGGVLSAGGTNTITLDPTANFRPGETVFVTVPSSVQSTGGQPAVKQAYQFTAGVGGTGQGTFGSGPNYTAAFKPRGMSAADVDGDGDLDLLSASEPFDNMLVLVNDGAGNFSATPTMPVGDSPEYVEPADIDNDGDLDLLIANAWSNNVSVRINNGSGTFSVAP
ncbi:MAG: VCBS repeat-containing protein, partial [Hymenobacteraceae bacterium]|nr:VCBS repeat-containing protein [Hymenobacteraceae bacterium]